MNRDIQESDAASSQWRKRNLFKILEAGIPEAIAESHRDWLYVLQHGEHSPTGWTLDWISLDEMKLLHSLLTTPVHSQTAQVLIEKLERQLR